MRKLDLDFSNMTPLPWFYAGGATYAGAGEPDYEQTARDEGWTQDDDGTIRHQRGRALTFESWQECCEDREYSVYPQMKNRLLLADRNNPQTGGAERDANLRFATHAAMCHGDLAAALRQTVAVMQEHEAVLAKPGGGHFLRVAIEHATTALAKAQGKMPAASVEDSNVDPDAEHGAAPDDDDDSAYDDDGNLRAGDR